MPKATLSFNLPEEQREYELANNAGHLASIIYEWSIRLREKTKHVDDTRTSWDLVKDEWWDLLQEERYNPYE